MRVDVYRSQLRRWPAAPGREASEMEEAKRDKIACSTHANRVSNLSAGSVDNRHAEFGDGKLILPSRLMSVVLRRAFGEVVTSVVAVQAMRCCLTKCLEGARLSG